MLLTLKLIGSWEFIDKLIWDHDTFWLCDQGGGSQKHAPWAAMYPMGPTYSHLKMPFKNALTVN